MEQDVWTQTLWRRVQARVHASRGENADAERLAREAVEIAEKSDDINRQGETFSDLAEVLAAAGRVDESAAAFEHALDRYKRKKNLTMFARVRPRYEALKQEHSPRDPTITQ